MVINQGGIAGFERCFAQIPTADFLQSFQRDALGTLRHGGRAEIGGMRGNGGQKCGIKVLKTRFVSRQGSERLSKSAAFVYVTQQVLDADARKTGFDSLTQPVDPFRDLQGVRPFQMQLSVAKRHKGILREALIQLSGDEVKLLE